LIDKYKNTKQYIWLQEEPGNAGALGYMMQHFNIVSLKYISRPASATPATGFHKSHIEEQENILKEAFS
jgi:2-oxoglutarate dehydrogenase E1 component